MENEQVPPEAEKQEMPRAEMPAMNPKTSGAKRYLIVFGYVAVAALFAYAGFAYRDYVKGDIEEKDDTMMVAEKDNGKMEVGSEVIPTSSDAGVMGATDGLKVEWREWIEFDADWFKQYRKYGYDSFEDPGSEEGKGEEINVDYYHVGSVLEEGEYKGSFVFLVQVECEGPCFSTPTFRFLKKGDERFLLAAYSEKDLSYYPGDYTVLEDVHLAGLEMPEMINGPAGEELVLDSTRNIRFSLTDRRVLFHSEVVGDVFVEEDAAVYKRNGFYVRMGDGTEAVYKVDIPFFGADDTVPGIVWADDTANTFDYLKGDIGGCGLLNLASVLDPKQVDFEVDLVPVGEASNGDLVYGFKDPDHEVLKGIYDGFYVYAGEGDEKMSYEEFTASHPAFIWVDDFGRMLKFQRLSYVPPVECGKPVIYLYPESEMDVSVKVEPVNGISVSEPEHGDGWKVTAKPDGTLTNHADGQSYPYLFWEGRGGLYETPREGYVMPQGEVEGFLSGMLGRYGLNDQEKGDFTEFWLPRMQGSPYYFVTFMTNRVMDELAPLTVEPKPDTVFRILMDYTPLDAPIDVPEPRTPHAFERDGFTVVEWGGVLGREAAQY